MIRLYGNIYHWIKHPDETELNLSFRKKVQVTLNILLMDVLLIFPFLGFLYIITSHLVELEIPLDDSHPVVLFILVVLLAPLIEEFIFRFPLKYKRNYLVRLINFFSRGWLKKRWSSVFKYFLYLLVILFGLIHLMNFNNNENLFFALAPFMIGNQLIGGFLLSYTRIKLGFIWSFIQHSAFNLIVVVFEVIFFHNQIIVKESNENFEVSIVEQVYVFKNTSYLQSKFDKDVIYSVNADDISLSGLLDSLNIQGIRQYEDRWIDVKIKSEKGMSRKELKNILKRDLILR
ncbi:CPBP family glutamic-type intramembrane protease [Autumnicola edwardsiae]|uniref:CPBP family glutamic-type intramembrane protease n=1 Tax=Autumnicola edwardsiae TaxID=3075594 RepID=A0ABU3CX68_9FLAO|nr:CPBP family glutamic-type intramembrane protease [Zunongwangia sp. F297]MDT0650911.1 CPBP family glutamic-type intramembrane protease [Zunongwangia sp. F297]